MKFLAMEDHGNGSSAESRSCTVWNRIVVSLDVDFKYWTVSPRSRCLGSHLAELSGKWTTAQMFHVFFTVGFFCVLFCECSR